MYNINRRKFLGYFGCSCCSLILPSCSTVPITERKQLSIISDARINKQASAAYEQFRKKSKLITTGPKLKQVRDIGKRMENSVSAFFKKDSEIPIGFSVFSDHQIVLRNPAGLDLRVYLW